MKISKSMLAAGVVTTVAVGSVVGTSLVSAHPGTDNASIVDKIASTFNLNKDEVEAVFEEARDERHQEMETKHAERLSSLVEAGTLTQDQANALAAKHDEMQATRESLKDQDLTREEMKDQMEAAREEFKTWAEEQGIDLESIRPEKGEGPRMGGHGGHRHMGPEDTEEN